MRRFAVLIFALAFPPLAASAQNETVTVQVGDPIGIWKFSNMQGFEFSFFSKSKWYPPTGDAFCQIEKLGADLSVHCLGFHINGKDVSRGTMRVMGDSLRMVWGSSTSFVGIKGAFQSANQFDGIEFIQVLGISDDAPGEVTGTRLTLSADAPDTGGNSALLARVLDEMAEGPLTVPLDPSGLVTTAKPGAPYIKILKPETLRPLGSIRSTIYLGQKWLPVLPTSVYDVEFANGHLICELHQAADDRLDYFDCG